MKNAIAHPVLTTKIAVGTGVVATIDGIRAVNNHTLAPVVNTTKAKLTERKYLKAARSVMKDQMLTIGAQVVAAKEARDAEVKAAAAARAQAESDAKFAAEMEADIAEHNAKVEAGSADNTITEEVVDAKIAEVIQVCNSLS